MADLNELTETHMGLARRSENGRSAELVAHDGELRQTVIALADGVRLPAHNSPPAASIQVLAGSIRVELGEEVQGEFGAGELWTLTHERHSVLALEDCAFLLTTVTSVDKPSFS
ncbi:cupin [Brevibacterium permense]|uniref:cupin n=1 Tax=Brevibacterium permense TaxID=234834 RepID=UPI0021D3843C|nr:cupin [Brevibacterium permense]